MQGPAPPSDGATRTDWRSIVLLALGFGLVGVDRFMISTLFPIIQKDLHLGYADVGIIAGALSIAWGLAALVMGNRADRIGRRTVLIGSMLAFALLIGASGLATGLLGLVAVRIFMGLADGAYVPASIAATLDCAEPRHHGLASGFQQMTAALFGLGLTPLVIASLLRFVEWRAVFAFVALPGLMLTWLMWRWLPRRAARDRPRSDGLADWRSVLGYRNVRLAMALMLCCLTVLVTTSAFMPGYLLEHSRLPFSEMSVVMSAIGIGSGVGTLVLPAASDRLGRKPVVVLSCLGAGLALGLLTVAGPNSYLIFALLFVVHSCNSATIALAVGPVAAEAVPAALMATASGLVICAGELFGGGLLPILAGHAIAKFGIGRFLLLPFAATCLATLTALFLASPTGSSNAAAAPV